jgi:anhydro-N-acetylmuramic acid kinase
MIRAWPATADRLTVVGLISGTSIDGVDAAVVEVSRREGGVAVQTLAALSAPFEPAMRARLLELCRPDAPLDAVCAANFDVAAVFAEAALAAIARAARPKETVDLIASHGQTIWHIPGHSTLQIGEAAVIVERTGLPVASNFRVRDIAAGGQGAPLVSAVDYLLFRDARRARALQNLGGIGNVTWIPAGAAPEEVIAFDTGPGNMVIDGVATLVAGRDRDDDGVLAARGTPHRGLLEELLRDPYFAQRPPKTTGRERYGEAYARDVVARGRALGLGAADLLATVTMLTVRTIADAYRAHLPGVEEVIVSGGGVHNATLLRWLGEALAPIPLTTVAAHGLDPDFKEAIAFGVIGALTAWGQPGNLPAATGARRPVLLGDLTFV